MKTCDECGICKKESVQKASLFIGLSFGVIIGVFICSVILFIKAVA